MNTNGVYAFPALTDDLYDVTVTADGFSENESQAVVRGGELTGIVVPLTSVSAEGEGEGEGEGETPGGCNCSQTNAKTGLPQSGDALLTGFTLLSLLLLGGLFRRS